MKPLLIPLIQLGNLGGALAPLPAPTSQRTSGRLMGGFGAFKAPPAARGVFAAVASPRR